MNSDAYSKLVLYKGSIGEDISNYVIMQFTGLEDKNGVDIFEGDIVEKSSEYKVVIQTNEKVKSPSYEIGNVIYENGSFQIKWIEGENAWFGKYPHQELIHRQNQEIKTIGNIHENK